MLDLLEQERCAGGAGCPTRSRENCCRDLLAAWRHAPLHEMGRRGWYDNCLANALDESQDHLGRGCAGELWHKTGMKDLRVQALADVDAEWEAGCLRWRDVQRLIEPFPKRGQLDTLKEGQDDEGDHDELEKGAVLAALWDDAVGLSDDDLDVDHGAALAASVTAQEAVGIHLSLAQQKSMALAREQLTRLQDVRESVKDFPHPRVLQTIDGILHQYKKKAVGCGQDDAEIARTLRAAVVGDEERGQVVRAAALAAAQISGTEAPRKRQRVVPVPSVPTAATRTHDLVAHTKRWLGRHVQLHLPRQFNAGDLGQGRCAGGGEKHYKARFELFVRVVHRLGNIDPAIENNIDRQFRRIDTLRRRNRFGWVSESYGSRFRDEMKSLLAAHERGETSALADWIKKWITQAGANSEIQV